jgi:hypothetical protein
MANIRRRLHRAEPTAHRAHAKSGLSSALGSLVTTRRKHRAEATAHRTHPESGLSAALASVVAARRRKHRAQAPANRIHAKAGLSAVGAVVTVITLVLVTVGSVFAPSGAATGKIRGYPVKIHRGATKTVTATVTATKTVAGPTATATVTKTVESPTGSPTMSGSMSGSPSATPTATPTLNSAAPYVGASVQGNGDPSAMEASAGRTLGLHRTYWNYSKISSSVSQATADAKAGRIPWLSYKLPVSWADAAAGKADAQTKDLAQQLATVPGEVWVAIHHEPEGDGDLSDWVAVQKRLLPLLAAAPNVRTSIILTAWDTFDSKNSAYSLDALWPGNMVDILGFDVYNRYGDVNHPDSGWTEMSRWYDLIAPAAKKRGVDWAIAETGYTDAAAAKDADWLTRAYEDMANRTDLPGLGLSYFNSTANSVGSWALTGVKVTKFDAILNESRD